MPIKGVLRNSEEIEPGLTPEERARKMGTCPSLRLSSAAVGRIAAEIRAAREPLERRVAELKVENDDLRSENLKLLAKHCSLPCPIRDEAGGETAQLEAINRALKREREACARVVEACLNVSYEVFISEEIRKGEESEYRA